MKSCWIFFIFFLIAFRTDFLFAQSVSKTARVSFEIEPVTTLKVASGSGATAVRLGPISPRAEIPPQPLEISIVTNTHQSYRVYHELQEDVVSESGAAFPSDRLLFMVTQGNRGGASSISNFTPVPQGETPIFTSKPEGGPDTFQILYAINNTKLFEAGTYYGNISIDLRNE